MLCCERGPLSLSQCGVDGVSAFLSRMKMKITALPEAIAALWWEEFFGPGSQSHNSFTSCTLELSPSLCSCVCSRGGSTASVFDFYGCFYLCSASRGAI